MNVKTMSVEEIKTLLDNARQKSVPLAIAAPIDNGINGFMIVGNHPTLVGDSALQAVVVSGEQMLNIAYQLIASYMQLVQYRAKGGDGKPHIALVKPSGR